MPQASAHHRETPQQLRVRAIQTTPGSDVEAHPFDRDKLEMRYRGGNSDSGRLTGALVELPWPPASLSGHNKGHWHAKSGIVSKHREWARLATLAANVTVPATGDIRLSITFYPPDRRGDRTNFANRAKPLIDGIADALKVNDRRFLPSYHFAEPVTNARVVVSIG